MAGDALAFRFRYLVHAAHRGKPNDWRSRPFCYVCAMKRLSAWRATDGR